MAKVSTKLLIASFIVITLLLTVVACVKTEEKESAPAVSKMAGMSPIYSKYKFENTDNVINIGIQPLYFPTGLISEVMKRDLILKEMLAKDGIEVRFYSFLKGADVNYYMKTGDLDAGIGGDMPAISAAAELDVEIPVLVQQGFLSLMVDRHMLIEELQGKRIAYAYGSNAHYALLNMLDSVGINESGVELIPMEVPEMADALKKGIIDGFSAWEPTPFLTLKKYNDTLAIHRSLSSGYMYFIKDLSVKYTRAVHHIIASEIRSVRWMQNSRRNLLQAGEWVLQESSELSGSSLDLSVEEIAELAMKDIIGIASIPAVPDHYLRENGPLHREFEFLKRLQRIPSSATWEKVRSSFKNSRLREVLANPGKYYLDRYEFDTGGMVNE